jgi:beta-lactamase regulating signal transducer with metallopeptidase domain
MSQEKVNQYKESKKNRKEIMKKDKQKAMIAKVIAGVAGAVLVAWLGYSAVVTVQNAEGPAVTVDTTAVTDYVNGL